MKKDNNNSKPSFEERPRKQLVTYFVNNQAVMPKSSRDYEWPEFNNDKDRIKCNKIRYANMSIAEAMCGIKDKEYVEPQLPISPTVGAIYQAKLTKKGSSAIISGISSKEQIVCKNNLGKYVNMDAKDKDVNIKVLSIDKVHQTIYVDALQPTFDGWINGILTDKSIQYNIKAPKVITVHNLRLSNGGFIGKAEIPAMSELVGEPFYVDAFIPGSQIVLNIEEDFTKWNGQTVDTFVIGYTPRPGTINQMCLICSRKALLGFSGNLTKIELYKDYCDNGKKWEAFTKSSFAGIITGVINNSKKCGVFVEIPMFNITGMINTAPEDLVKYKAGETINVKITDFEQMLEFDPILNTQVHKEPYIIEDGCLKKCILKPVLELA